MIFDNLGWSSISMLLEHKRQPYDIITCAGFMVMDWEPFDKNLEKMLTILTKSDKNQIKGKCSFTLSSGINGPQNTFDFHFCLL